MALSNNKNENRHQPDIPDCEERDNATQQKINTLKKIYCQNLKDSESEIETLKIGYESNEKIYKSKERRFLSTRDNCHRYINTEISMGSQLVQANEKIKASVANYKTWDEALAKKLKDIFVAVKDVKTKMSDLRDAASKLENSKHDSCNASQWTLITGKDADNCKDETNPQPPVPPETCRDAEEVIELLFCMPRALLLDIDSIFKSSSDIIGVQKFCNTGSLVALQQNLYTSAQDFDTLLLSTITTRKTDLDARQQELKDALKNRTGSVMDLYSQRCNYSGIHTTLDKICCPKCGCVNYEIGHCEPRLESCECEICEICGEVRNAFTNQDTAPQPAPAA
jgi:hypothetical protein